MNLFKKHGVGARRFELGMKVVHKQQSSLFCRPNCRCKQTLGDGSTALMKDVEGIRVQASPTVAWLKFLSLAWMQMEVTHL